MKRFQSSSHSVNSSAPAQGVVSQSIMKEMNKIYGGSALKNHRNKAATPLLNHQLEQPPSNSAHTSFELRSKYSSTAKPGRRRNADSRAQERQLSPDAMYSEGKLFQASNGKKGAKGSTLEQRVRLAKREEQEPR